MARKRARASATASPSSVHLFVEGGRSKCICFQCNALRDTVYRYRPVRLEVSRVTVENVLVGVCLTCNATVSIPTGAEHRFKAAIDSARAAADAGTPAPDR